MQIENFKFFALQAHEAAAHNCTLYFPFFNLQRFENG